MNTIEISPNPNYPVLVIGASGLDMIGHLRVKLLGGTSNPADIRTSFGGTARNVAENLARLGQEVILLSAVGEDPLGDQLIRQAEEAGINTDYVVRTPMHPTGTYVGILNKEVGLEYAIDDMDVVEVITPAYIQKHTQLFKDASIVFVDMNLSAPALKTIMNLARKYKLPVCADPTSTILTCKLKPYLSQLFLITPNNVEAALLTDPDRKITTRRQALVAAKELVAKGVGVVLITMGELGLCYATSESSGHIPAVRTTVMDPTGVGDALTATVIFGLLNDIPLDDAVRLGASAAAITLRYPGTVVADLTLQKLYDTLVI